jgi:hypothetical protein
MKVQVKRAITLPVMVLSVKHSMTQHHTACLPPPVYQLDNVPLDSFCTIVINSITQHDTSDSDAPCCMTLPSSCACRSRVYYRARSKTLTQSLTQCLTS